MALSNVTPRFLTLRDGLFSVTYGDRDVREYACRGFGSNKEFCFVILKKQHIIGTSSSLFQKYNYM